MIPQPEKTDRCKAFRADQQLQFQKHPAWPEAKSQDDLKSPTNEVPKATNAVQKGSKVCYK